MAENALLPPKIVGQAHGYNIRNPYPGEDEYFRQNKNVAGMAAEDGNIVMNPYSGINEQEKQGVIKNEALRLHMRDKGMEFGFPVTDEQKAPFAGTPYGAPENINALRSTILSRILTGDPSAGNITPEQRIAAARVGRGFNSLSPR